MQLKPIVTQSHMFICFKCLTVSFVIGQSDDFGLMTRLCQILTANLFKLNVSHEAFVLFSVMVRLARCHVPKDF